MARNQIAAGTRDLMHNLPSEIVELILARLPVKSILRFRSVSKLWNQIISQPQFSNLHSQLRAPDSSSFPTRFLVKGMASNSLCFLNFSEEGFHVDAPLGALFGKAEIRILCYCNGLVLLRSGHRRGHKRYVLWNPYTRMCRNIPWKYKPVAHGICHDPTTDDYKLVTINSSPESFSVFSCKQRVWTKRKENLNYGRTDNEQGVYVDGACYWICCIDQPFNLLCFDGIEEKFEMLPLPEDTLMAEDPRRLINLGGCLCLIYCDYSVWIHIWSMEKNGEGNSWRRKTTIDCGQYGTRYYDRVWSPCPVSDRLAAISLDRSTFIVYDAYEERVVQGPLKIPERWNGKLIHLNKYWNAKLIPCHERMFISMF